MKNADCGQFRECGNARVSAEDPDTDGDGIPDAWEIANFLDPDSSDFEVDTDHDGRSDFLEYAFGGNPHGADPDRGSSCGAVQETGADYLSLSFDRRKYSSLVYRVMESSTLASWAEVTLASRMIGTPTDHDEALSE